MLQALIAHQPAEQRPIVRGWLPSGFMPPQVTILSMQPFAEDIAIRTLDSAAMPLGLCGDTLASRPRWRARPVRIPGNVFHPSALSLDSSLIPQRRFQTRADRPRGCQSDAAQIRLSRSRVTSPGARVCSELHTRRDRHTLSDAAHREMPRTLTGIMTIASKTCRRLCRFGPAPHDRASPGTCRIEVWRSIRIPARESPDADQIVLLLCDGVVLLTIAFPAGRGLQFVARAAACVAAALAAVHSIDEDPTSGSPVSSPSRCC